MPSPRCFKNPRVIVFWEQAKEKTMLDKLKNLTKTEKLLLAGGIILVLAVMLYIGVDPANDFALLND